MSNTFEDNDQEGQSAPDGESQKRNRGGQLGNQNARNGRIVGEAYLRILTRMGASIEGEGTALEKGTEAAFSYLLKQCTKGNVAALKELADRLDGRSPQAIEVTGEDGEPLPTLVYIPVSACPPDK